MPTDLQSFKTDRLRLIVIGVIALVLFLGDSPFATRGEPREAVVAMSMLHDGNWILPVNNGDEIAFKPPLLHWLVAAFSWISGSVSELTSRLPSALAGLAMVVSTFVFFARRGERRTALLAAMICLTCFEVHRDAMTCRVDMLLAALTVMALYALYAWGERAHRGIPWAATLCLAGAALTKGPVGIVLPCGVYALFVLCHDARRLWRVWLRLAGVAVLALLPLTAWYVAAYLQPHGGDRFLQLIYEENVLRFTGQMTYASHINPWPYNVVMIVAGMLPFTLLLPVSVWLLPKAFKGLSLKGFHPLRWLHSLSPLTLFALTSAVVIFVFYCIPASKRGVYLLPLYPFLAWFTARFMLWLDAHHHRTLSVWSRFVGGLTLLLALCFIAVKCGWVRGEMLFSGKHAAQNIAFVRSLADVSWGFWSVVLTLSAVLVGLRTLFRPMGGDVRLAVVSLFVVWLNYDAIYKPAVMTVQTDKAVAAEVAKRATTGTIYSFRTDVLEANRMHPFTINFYLGDRIIPIDKAPSAPAEGYLVTGNDEIEAFLKAYPAYEAHLVYDSHHRSCDDRKVVKLYRFEANPTPKTRFKNDKN